MLPRRGHGDGVGLRPEGTAVGDGLPREDARAGSGILVAAVDGLDRGGAAGLGRATTADAARETGISHGLASHHLRQLAKYGFLEQVKGKDHRERPWRLVATSYNWSGARATAEGSVAVDVLEQMTAERTIEAFLDWQQRRTVWPQAWREHAGLGESSVYLTQAELAGIVEAMDALLVRYTDARPIDDVASRPEGSVPVTFTLFAVPGGPPPGPEATTES